MKRIIPVALFAGCAALAAGLAFGASDPVKETGSTEVKGAEYHHLLMLDLKEAGEHARVLHHYAQFHAKHLDKQVVMRHVDELTKNLDGVRTELADVEQNVNEPEKASVEPRLSTIRSEEEKARQDLVALKAEEAKDQPDATVIAAKSRAIYEAMVQAGEHHRKAMTTRGVREPAEPVTKK